MVLFHFKTSNCQTEFFDKMAFVKLNAFPTRTESMTENFITLVEVAKCFIVFQQNALKNVRFCRKAGIRDDDLTILL